MFDPKQFDELVKKLMSALPSGIRDAAGDLEKNFRSIVLSAFRGMDLVTREEFDAQKRVLERTRKQVTALEKKVSTMEQGKHKPKPHKKPAK